MMPKSTESIQIAIAQLQAGNYMGAEYFCKEVLSTDPRSFDALQLLGIIKITQSDLEGAIPYLKKAFEIKPHDIPAAINLGTAYIESSLYANAEFVYSAAQLSNSSSIELKFGRAIALQGLGRIQEAITEYEKIMLIAPSFLNARINYAVILSDAGELFTALNMLNEVKGREINDERFWSNLAAIYVRLKMWEDADESISKAIQINPKDLHLQVKKGEILLGLIRPELAKSFFEKVVDADPSNIEAWMGLGNANFDLDELQVGLEAVDVALQIDRLNPSAVCTKGVLLNSQGKTDEALQYFDEVRAIDCNFPEAIYNSAHIHLERFNFVEGWDGYEYRWKVRAFNSPRLLSDRRLWDGKPIDGTLLIWGEQGVGDQILYSSILTILKGYATKVAVYLDIRLLPIFSRSFPDIDFIASKTEFDNYIYDKQLPIGSLGRYFLLSTADFFNRSSPYLFSNIEIKDKFKVQVQEKKNLICGLSWSSNAARNARNKSFNLFDLSPIFTNRKMSFIDVGYMDTAQERYQLSRKYAIEIKKFSEINSFEDINGLTALIDMCDLIITCSNTCAHIAGALGKKVYLLLPKYKGKFWYWQDINGISLWYPSVSILRQEEGGSWHAPIQKLKTILEDLNE